MYLFFSGLLTHLVPASTQLQYFYMIMSLVTTGQMTVIGMKYFSIIAFGSI